MIKLPKEKDNKPKESSFQNNTLLDKVINKMAGDEERLTSAEIKPVYDAKLKEVKEALAKATKDFAEKYDKHPVKQMILDRLAMLEKEDPDFFSEVFIYSREKEKQQMRLCSIESFVLIDKITYPKDTIEKINKI